MSMAPKLRAGLSAKALNCLGSASPASCLILEGLTFALLLDLANQKAGRLGAVGKAELLVAVLQLPLGHLNPVKVFMIEEFRIPIEIAAVKGARGDKPFVANKLRQFCKMLGLAVPRRPKEIV